MPRKKSYVRLTRYNANSFGLSVVQYDKTGFGSGVTTNLTRALLDSLALQIKLETQKKRG